MNSQSRDIAVVGMSGKFPGADSVAEFWRNLCAGTQSIGQLSDEQLRLAGVSDADLNDSSYVKAAARLNGVDLFDPGFFKISPLEAELMDPQIRLLLQCAWEALEDAGHASKGPQNIGVFAGAGGVTTSYFANFVNVNRRFEKVTAGATHLGNDKDFLATYISYKLNLTGPSITVQTACSTSLVALHQARLSLLNGECDMALAGGVTVRVPHGVGYHYREGYIFSKSGQIRTFDEGADGVVFGSGLGLVLIKRLADAVRDGNRIYAVIKGSAIANDGKGKMSYAASSAKGQIACINHALADARISAGDIGFVESHGTGTAMGDPEEVKALSAAFKAQTEQKGYCALGAVKANIGHLEAAAGIVGFIKAVLAVDRGVIPPAVGYSKPNSRIRFENTPFYVNTTLREWDAGEKLRHAAINSLGVGGTNAFVVLEEYVSAETSIPAAAPAPVIVPISAKSQSSLDAYVRRLADFLAASNDATDIGDLAYTLQVGREPMDHRVAFIASSVADLRAELARYLDRGAAPTEGVILPGQPAEHAETDVEAWIDAREWTKLAQHWVNRFEVDWHKLHTGVRRPERIHLPTYAFAKERYWIEADRPAAARTVLHPLLHVNTSDLNEQKYTSTFDGGEFFLNDHQVRAAGLDEAAPRKILPGVAYLEMARVALEHAVPPEPESKSRFVELRDVIWVQPIAVDEPREVSIALLSENSTLEFEVYGEGESIHCQGQASFGSDDVPAPLDIAALRQQLRQGQWTSDDIYTAFEKMGLCYGPAHRALTEIERGERQLLAHLELPAAVVASQADFILHPSLMDGAFQSTLGLLFDLKSVPGDPVVPFALDRVRVLSACTSEMYAWVRFAPGSHGNLTKFDIDLCDLDGRICVQIRGFASRSLSKPARVMDSQIDASGHLLAAGEWRLASAAAGTVPVVYAERHVIVCGLPQIDPDALAGAAPTRQVSCASQASGKDIAERYADAALACFERVRAVLESKPTGKVLVQFVVPSSGDESLMAGLSGLLKTARLENPQLIGQVVLVPAAIGTDSLASHLSAEQNHPNDALIKLESDARYVFGWSVQEKRSALGQGGVFKNGGVYLLTGGLGGLGTRFAKEILNHVRDARIVLTGRLTTAEVARSVKHRTTLESIQALGSTVEYRQLDLADPDRVKELIASVRDQYQGINGIIHCAGMVADSFILKKSTRQFEQVLAPKVQGTFHLDQATRDLDLDFFALFSSLTSAVGNPGQADYAAANGFMDQFAGHRNRLVEAGQRRGRTVAIHWPFWQDGGMQLDAAGLATLYETTGIRPMATATGVQAFYDSLASEHDELLPMEGDLDKLRHTLSTALAIPADSASTDTEQAPAATNVQGDLLELTQSYLCRHLAALLKLPAHKVQARAPLENYGIDSILALDFTRVLERDFGSLPKTLFFEYLTIRDLADYFVSAHVAKLNSLFATSGAPAPRIDAPTRTLAPPKSIVSKRSNGRRFAADSSAPTQSVSEPIAIVGLSGRYPQSRDIDAFWDNLRDGKDCIIEVPPERWDWREYYTEDRERSDGHFSKWGGFIEGVDEFDPRFFNISPREATTIDPQERLFLQHCWMAVENAGYTRERLQIPRESRLSAQVGVYAGVMYGEYNLSGNLASIANRVSYFLNLHGPSITLDTMCSSSLTAIHLACQDLKLGRTDLAIAGGVNVSIHPNKYSMLSTGRFISSDGHCQSFGEGGDGYIPAEGVGVVILKRLSEALGDGDQIYGIIRGSSVNHGGKTNGYTVPNPQAQAAVIGDVLLESQVDPRHISYIEAHGTGTKLGDPIEIAALSKAFQRASQDKGFCLIGSAKSNIGHAESAAGIAGLTKVLLQMKHRQVVPSLHSQRLNPHIDFSSTPFVVNQNLRDWPQPVIEGRARPRIAGISSFGAGGANAHLIVEEYSGEEAVTPAQPVEVLIPLSARTADQLRQKIQDLLGFVSTAPSFDLGALAFTLQTGREALAERLGVIAGSREDLTTRLQACLRTPEQQIEGIFRGQAGSQHDALSLVTADVDFEATVARWIERGKLDKLLSVWVQGFNVDWNKLWPGARPRRISLPAYPFARERYWNAGPAFAEQSAREARNQAPAPVLHSLLHRNTSTLSQQSYASEFDEGLSALAQLEMVRAAVADATACTSSEAPIELKDIVWSSPITATQVRVVLSGDEDDVHFVVYSEEGDEEVIHCEGRAWFEEQLESETLDLEQVAARLRDETLAADEVLDEVSLPEARTGERSDIVFDSGIAELALQVVARLLGGPVQISLPQELRSLRLISPCPHTMMVWARLTAEDTLDVDLCDARGVVCAQFAGLRYRVETSDNRQVEPKPGEIQVPLAIARFAPAPLAKPTGVALIKPEEASLTVPNVARPRIRLGALESPIEPSGTREDSQVRLVEQGDGVFHLDIEAPETGNALSSELIEQLLQGLARAEQEPTLKTLVISGTAQDFLSGDRGACDAAIARGLYRAIASFPVPVIACVQGDAIGAGFLAAALCDFMVVSREGRYAYTLPDAQLYPTADEFHVFSERFGDAGASQLLYMSPEATGVSLNEAKWGCPVLPRDEVPAYADKLATTLAGMPRKSLELLKAHLARDIRSRVETLRPAGNSPSRKASVPHLPLDLSCRFIRFESLPQGVLGITVRSVANANDARVLVSELTQMFAALATAGYRAIVVASESGAFLAGLDGAIPDEAVLQLRRLLFALPVPVIGALNNGASGVGWLISHYFDACVHGEASFYSAGELSTSSRLAREAAVMFPARLSTSPGNEIVLTGGRYSGRELVQRAAVSVAKDDRVRARATEIASFWSEFPAEVLQSWKASRVASIESVRLLEAVDESSAVIEHLSHPQPVALASEVIRATSYPGGILLVSMEDRQARNRFSADFIAGMNEVFEHIEQTPAYKVVILTGYDNYFASGGTKQALLAIQQGTLKYTDVAVFELPIRCKLPVIAAMQGHTVGAGWSLGLCCDLIACSEESIYSTRFMSFGFTPGAASTMILPRKLGRDLSIELLMTARDISGGGLRERGVTVPVLPRREVLPAAMKMAEALARNERSTLIALKRQLNQFFSEHLDETYRYELEMQERTFVGQREVLERIRSSYMQDESDPSMSDAKKVMAPPVSDKLAGLTASLGKLLAEELYLREDEIDEHTQFVDMGLDSITGVTWIRKINEKYGLTVEATKVYSHPTLAELSRHVKDELIKHGAPEVQPANVAVAPVSRRTSGSINLPSRTKTVRAKAAPVAEIAPAPQASPQSSTVAEPIAVIGMAGQFPKAGNLDAFWKNIIGGVDCISVIPKHRWDVDAYYQAGAPAAGKMLCKWMGALDDYDTFDPLFFSISPTEAELMDPQQRLFLQTCWHAIEDAGYGAGSLSGSKTGVFAGCAAGDYYRDPGTHRLNAQQLMGSAPSILAARISYFLNLQGPCVSVDTACSSSLVALATACDSLCSGASDVALAGGVQVFAGPAMHIMTSQAGMLSPDGRCFTFDDRANGFVPAEAVGVVMLKRLSDAERDQDFIYGVIRGWGVNQDGKTNGITAPNPESQTRLQQSVYEKYRIDPEHIQLIEAHGTGTKLGDPIEIEGLKAAFGKYTRKAGYCAVGSVKSNMGHALNGAGISGFIKLMLALKHRQLPPTIHFERINQHIALENSPFYINGELREWQLNGAPLRQAAISSFGFSGTNCHMVVSEAPAAVEDSKGPVSSILQEGRMAIPLSARTEEQLRQRASDLLAFTRARAGDTDLQELTYTLQVGREPMDYRLGVMASSIAELADKLQEYLSGGSAVGCYRGQVKQNKEGLRVITQDEVVKDTIIERYLARGEVDKLLQLWTKGLDIDWNRLYADRKPRRVALPVYPFAKERYWLEAKGGSDIASPRAVESVLHPLLHRNTSDFTEQRYSTGLTGSEPFLVDHLVAGKKVLPGVAYLEMARAAIADAAAGNEGVLTLRNVVWSRPVTVAGGPKVVQIALHPEASGEIAYEITSGVDTEQTVHCSGRGGFGVQAGDSSVDIQRVKARVSRKTVGREQYYRTLDGMGLQYGDSHRRIVELHVGEGEVLARLAPPEATGSSRYILHPGLLDAAFHASLAVQDTTQPVPLLPFALERIDILGDCSRSTWAWVRVAEGAATSDNVRKLDIDLCNEDGSVSVRVRGLSARAMQSDLSDESAATLMLEPVWVEQIATAQSGLPEPAERLLFLCGFDGVASALREKMPETSVLCLSATAPTLAGRFHGYAVQLFECLQRLTAQKSRGSALIQVLVPDRDDGEIHAGLWSLLQSAHLENSKITGQVIALDPATPAADLHAKLRDNAQCAQAGQIRYEQDHRYVKQLSELTRPTASANPWRNGVYLITGGAGGLGLIFAQAIAASADEATIILTGRSELDAESQQRVDRLRTDATRVEYRRVDVTDSDAVQALVQSIQREHGGLTGVLHCAGIIRDNYIANKSIADFEAVLAPKIAGVANLDEATRSLDLEFFVLFSSIGGVLGGAGQSDYAVANAFMDGYASYRNCLVSNGQRTGRTLSINWPLWQSDGMGVDAAKEAFFKAHFGMLAMPEARGLQAFDHALGSDRSQVMVMDGILQRMRQRLLPAPATHEPPKQVSVQASQSVELDQHTLISRIQDTLRKKVARFLKIREEQLDFDTELTEFGFDSISLTEFTNELNQDLKLDLTPTVFFEYPTIAALAGHLSEARRDLFVSTFAPRIEKPQPSLPPPAIEPVKEVKPRQRFAAVKVTHATQAAEPEDDPIAIIGVSGKFPQAETLDQFWENLRAGRDCIEEVPASRWDWRAIHGDPRTEENKTNIKWGAFIDGVDEFDPLFFGISPREAQLMDPQQRLLMTYAWKVIEDAGYAPDSLSGSSVGIFVGTYTSGYQELAAEAGIAIDGYSSTGMSTSIGPNRMSYFLNLHGPSEPIETACSSSLVAIHRAVQAIKTGSCEAAIAGGVNTIVNPRNHIAFSKAGMLSEDGRCKTFSDRANGYVRGEGVGMLFLKKLSAAERDGDPIHAVIRGSAENHGGRASSLTAPNPKAQASLLVTAYRQAGIDPRTIGYIEAHGTGTELGDPIEINALKSAFQTLYAEAPQSEVAAISAHCGLGSLKSNIGHLELAAGVAGVIKVLLQLKHETRVKSLHCDTINPYIDLTGSPFYITRENDDWTRVKDRAQRELPRRAGVSSFGFGGVNAHVVIEEYMPGVDDAAKRMGTNGPHLIVLSARTEASLEQAATNLVEYLEGVGRATDLARIAYTLQVGRNGMEQRLATVVQSREELLDKLRKFLNGDDNGVYRGEIKRSQDTLAVFTGDEDLRSAVDVWIQKGKYDKLLSLWVKGLAFDWNTLYGDKKPARVSLPTYAFARERVWIEAPATQRQQQRRRDVLHPLLHLNTSNLDQQSYRTVLTGEEFFLDHHRVRSEPVLPAVAYLEMARAAVEHALPGEAARSLELCDTTWLKPCTVTEPRDVTIVLNVSEDDESIDFEILSHTAGQASLHCQGTVIPRGDTRSEKINVEQLLRRMNGHTLQANEIYTALGGMGLNYGPAHRAVTSVHVDEGELLARLKLPPMPKDARDQYLLHPSLMDGALQASIGFLLARGQVPTQPWVPFALESAHVLAPCTDEMYAWIRRTESGSQADTLLKVDLDLFDQHGNACVLLRGFSARALQSDNPNDSFDDSLYHRIIAGVINNELSIEAAVDLG